MTMHPDPAEQWLVAVLCGVANPADEGHPMVDEPWLHDPVTWTDAVDRETGLHEVDPPGWMVDLWLDYLDVTYGYNLD